jgi:hypothetical protein
MANSYKTLEAGMRWLVKILSVVSTPSAGKISAADLITAEQSAYNKIKKRLGRRFDTTTWEATTPSEVAEAADALGSALVLKWWGGQTGSTGKGSPPAWEAAETEAEAILKQVEKDGKVTFDDGTDDQIAKFARGCRVKGSGATFFPNEDTDTSHDLSTPENVEDTYRDGVW